MTTPAQAGQAAQVADLAWMSGDWLQETDDATVQETWSTPCQSRMAAVGQTHKPGKPGEVMFENLSHDVPQRVIYRRCDGNLRARIEGTLNGKVQGMG